MSESEKRVCEFGPFRFDAGQRLLFRGADIVALTPKAIDTLAVLIGRRGEVVEKDELMRLVWPDTFVEEGGLARNISTLRKALGDEYIETIPKRGYRFVAPVVSPEISLPAPKRRRWAVAAVAAVALLAVSAYLAARWWQEKTAEPRIESLAVLPLRDLSRNPEQAYFSEGMTEVLITNLAKMGPLRVIAPESAMRFQGQRPPLDEIARKLKVDAVVQGTVLSVGGRVRVTAELVETKSGRLMWAEKYEREMSDVLALQNEVAAAIAREVRVNLTPEQRAGLAHSRPVTPAAYQNYLKGRYFWNRRTEAGLKQAVEHFEQAIAKDPGYALAYAGLADAYALLGSNGIDALPPVKAMPLAKEAALKAVKLDETLAEAHTSLAYVAMSYDWDLPAAEREFRRALELNPGYATAHHWYGHYFLAARQPEKALEQMRKALDLDPLSLPIHTGVGWCLYYARSYDEAIAEYRKALDLDPHFALAHQTIGMAYEQKGMRAEAIAELRKAVELSGGNPSAMASLGYTYGQAGERAKAQAELTSLRELAKSRYVPAIYFAFIHAGLGERQQAAAWLKKARAERSDYLVYGKADPLLAGVEKQD